MKELIRINIAGSRNSVSGRELHKFLNVKRDFITWVEQRIEKYEFESGIDYAISEDLRSPETGNAKARPQTRLNYYISLEMAKELAIVENNDKGREARKYFISCEKAIKEKMLPQNFAEALRLAADQAEQKENNMAGASRDKNILDVLERKQDLIEFFREG